MSYIIQREDGLYVRKGGYPSSTPHITEASVYLTARGARASSEYRDCCERYTPEGAHYSRIKLGEDGKRIFNGTLWRITDIETELVV